MYKSVTIALTILGQVFLAGSAAVSRRTPAVQPNFGAKFGGVWLPSVLDGSVSNLSPILFFDNGQTVTLVWSSYRILDGLLTNDSQEIMIADGAVFKGQLTLDRPNGTLKMNGILWKDNQSHRFHDTIQFGLGNTLTFNSVNPNPSYISQAAGDLLEQSSLQKQYVPYIANASVGCCMECGVAMRATPANTIVDGMLYHLRCYAVALIRQHGCPLKHDNETTVTEESGKAASSAGKQKTKIMSRCLRRLAGYWLAETTNAQMTAFVIYPRLSRGAVFDIVFNTGKWKANVDLNRAPDHQMSDDCTMTYNSQTVGAMTFKLYDDGELVVSANGWSYGYRNSNRQPPPPPVNNATIVGRCGLCRMELYTDSTIVHGNVCGDRFHSICYLSYYTGKWKPTDEWLVPGQPAVVQVKKRPANVQLLYPVEQPAPAPQLPPQAPQYASNFAPHFEYGPGPTSHPREPYQPHVGPHFAPLPEWASPVLPQAPPQYQPPTGPGGLPFRRRTASGLRQFTINAEPLDFSQAGQTVKYEPNEFSGQSSGPFNRRWIKAEPVDLPQRHSSYRHSIIAPAPGNVGSTYRSPTPGNADGSAPRRSSSRTSKNPKTPKGPKNEYN